LRSFNTQCHLSSSLQILLASLLEIVLRSPDDYRNREQ
jgi:hypothetical protein